jgi:two-component system, response regulator
MQKGENMNTTAEIEILLVEDNQDDLDLALLGLRRGNLAVPIRVVRDGAEALDYIFCEGNHAGRKIENTPKVVLLDLNLPKIDGMEVLVRIKGDPRTKKIPVIVLTASQEQQDMISSYHLAADGYITKPVDLEKFAATVEKLGMYSALLHQPIDMLQDNKTAGKLKMK